MKGLLKLSAAKTNILVIRGNFTFPITFTVFVIWDPMHRLQQKYRSKVYFSQQFLSNYAYSYKYFKYCRCHI